MSTAAQRLAVAGAALLGALLVAEGALTLAGGPSLRRLVRPGPSKDDPARLYRLDPDPLVGYTLFPDSEMRILEGGFHTDALGMRVTPGLSSRTEGPLIVVLGDSVAFGFGVNDDETLACRLQSLLNASRGGALPPVRCRTIAVPGWNTRNQVHFLLDHLDAIDPDIVLHVPIGNDLADTDSCNQDGQRRIVPDPAGADPLLCANLNGQWTLLEEWKKRAMSGELASVVERTGPGAMTLDVSPESSRRYDENAATLRLLLDVMARRGGHVAILPYMENEYLWHLGRRFVEQGLDVTTIPLLAQVAAGMTLRDDGHPNANTHDALARWVAAELLARGWVERGEGRPVDPPGEPWASSRAGVRSAQEIVELSDSWHKAARRKLRDRIDFGDLTGVSQLYGGLNEDGSAAARLLALVARGGERLHVRLAPLAGRPDLYPLSVAVDADGRRLGTLELAADGATEAELSLPPSGSGTVEVRLSPERWVVVGSGAEQRLASCVPQLIACER